MSLVKMSVSIDFSSDPHEDVTPLAMSLIEASKKGNIDRIRELLEDSTTDLNETDAGNNCALHYAVKTNNIRLVKILLDDARVDINKESSWNGTPLIIACVYDMVEILKLLLEDSRIDVKCLCHGGGSILNLAIRFNRTDILKILLEDGRFDLNLENNNNNTPLIHACSNNDVVNTKLLLNDDRTIINKINGDGFSCIFYAIIVNATDVIRLLIEDGRVDLNVSYPNIIVPQENVPVLETCKNGRSSQEKLFIERNLNDFYNKHPGDLTPLMYACCYGNVTIVKLILETNPVEVPLPNNDFTIDVNRVLSEYHQIEFDESTDNYKRCLEVIQVIDEKGNEYTDLVGFRYRGDTLSSIMEKVKEMAQFKYNWIYGKITIWFNETKTFGSDLNWDEAPGKYAITIEKELPIFNLNLSS